MFHVLFKTYVIANAKWSVKKLRARNILVNIKYLSRYIISLRFVTVRCATLKSAIFFVVRYEARDIINISSRWSPGMHNSVAD